jgi:diguanylate cyclase (GGDEF)-like protein/PAS domain S-box-containing protein
MGDVPALVLVIDDAPEIHEGISLRLRQLREPVEIVRALDGDTGLRLARERRPEVVLLDLDLDGTSGLALCRKLVDDHRLRSTSVILLTGAGDVAAKVSAFEAGASDYVTKPFEGVELVARVQAALRMTRYRFHLERAASQRETLLELSGATASAWGERLRVILRADAQTLEVERVSYWKLVNSGAAIECEARYRHTTRDYESGMKLAAADYPTYFRALRAASAVVAADAKTHPDTRDTAQLGSRGVDSLMQVPVFVQGELVGVVCHEHVGGARVWAADEVQFAVSIGHMLSLAIESEKRRLAEEALKESEARFRAIAQASPIPLIVNSLAGRCLWGNSALAALADVSETDMINRDVPAFYANPADRDDLLRELRDKGVVDRREVRLRRGNGEEYWGMVSARPLVFDGQPAMIAGLADLTEQKRLEETLRHTALHDALTGLPNRSLLFEILRREMGRAERDPNYRFCLLYFDLDGFKLVNDELGHEAGDQLLVSVARQVAECMRAMDAVARVGGDEFAAVIANVSEHSDVDRIVRRVEAAIAGPHRVGNSERVVGASIGVAIADGRICDVGALLRSADEAMYQRKRVRLSSNHP